MFARTISLIDQTYMVMHHHQPEYHSETMYLFAMAEVKATIVSTRSSSILNTLTPPEGVCLLLLLFCCCCCCFVFCCCVCFFCVFFFFFWWGGGGGGEGEIWHLVTSSSSFFFFFYIPSTRMVTIQHKRALFSFGSLEFHEQLVPSASTRKDRRDRQPQQDPQAKQSVYLAACSVNSCAEQSQKLSPDNQLLKPEAKDRPAAK